MTFFNSIMTCYKKSFDFKGRASKSEYWWFWLVQVPITFIALGALGAWNSEKFDAGSVFRDYYSLYSCKPFFYGT